MQYQMKKILQIKYFTTIFIALLIIFCDKNPFHPEKNSQPTGNKPPETYLFLFVMSDTVSSPDSVYIDSVGIDTTASKQVLHWWGDDSDGEVIGYYIQWDYQSKPIWTTSEYDTFYTPIRTKFDQFTFN